MRSLLALVLAAGFVGTASACINDRELPSHEREFRSQYQEEEAIPTSVEDGSPTNNFILGGLGATGVILAVGGSVLLLRMRGHNS
jgi:hypothetical protein